MNKAPTRPIVQVSPPILSDSMPFRSTDLSFRNLFGKNGKRGNFTIKTDYGVDCNLYLRILTLYGRKIECSWRCVQRNMPDVKVIRRHLQSNRGDVISVL